MSLYFVWKLPIYKGTFIQVNLSISNIYQKIKNKLTYKIGQSLKKSIQILSQVCINSGLLKWRLDNFHRVKILNLSEKNIFLRFLYREGKKGTCETRVRLQTSKPLIVGKQYYKWNSNIESMTGFSSHSLFPLNSPYQKELGYNWIIRDYFIVTNPWRIDKVKQWKGLVLFYELI